MVGGGSGGWWALGVWVSVVLAVVALIVLVMFVTHTKQNPSTSTDHFRAFCRDQQRQT